MLRSSRKCAITHASLQFTAFLDKTLPNLALQLRDRTTYSALYHCNGRRVTKANVFQRVLVALTLEVASGPKGATAATLASWTVPIM